MTTLELTIDERHGSNASVMLTRLGGNPFEIINNYQAALDNPQPFDDLLFGGRAIEDDADICFQLIAKEVKERWAAMLTREQAVTLGNILLISDGLNGGYEICYDVTIQWDELVKLWNEQHPDAEHITAPHTYDLP